MLRSTSILDGQGKQEESCLPRSGIQPHYTTTPTIMMPWKTRHSGTIVLFSLALMALVAVLAALQYSWLGRLSERELDQMRSNLRMASLHLALDLNQEMNQAVRTFDNDIRDPESSIPPVLLASINDWDRASNALPFIGSIYVVRYLPESEAPSLSVLDTTARKLVRIDAIGGDGAMGSRRLSDTSVWIPNEYGPGRRVYFLKDLHGFAIPFAGRQQLPRAPYSPEADRRNEDSFVFVSLEWQYLQKVMLPGLVRTYFASMGKNEWDVAIVTCTTPLRILYLSNPADTALDLSRPNITVGVGQMPPMPISSLPATILFPDEGDNSDRRGEGDDPLRQGRQDFGPENSNAPPPQQPEGQFREGSQPARPNDVAQGGSTRRDARREMFGPRQGRPGRRNVCEVRVFHRGGSLEEVVNQNRARNLGLSLGIIVLLAGSVAILILSASRAQRQASQQIEFVAGVSHELRTPLAVVRSIGDNLAEGAVDNPSRIREYGRYVQSESDRLSSLVDNALAYAGIHSGKSRFELTPSQPDRILNSALQACSGMIRQAGITLEKDIAQNLPTINADFQALQLAIQNLLVNAVKYGSTGKWAGVSVGQGAGGQEVVFAVRDHGIGIPKEDLKDIFEPFYRGRNVADGTTRGSGLGLNIAYQIVKAHKGTITFESQLGKGSAFFIHIPVETKG